MLIASGPGLVMFNSGSIEFVVDGWGLIRESSGDSWGQVAGVVGPTAGVLQSLGVGGRIASHLTPNDAKPNHQDVAMRGRSGEVCSRRACKLLGGFGIVSSCEN